MKTEIFTLLALTCIMLSSCNNELDEKVAITDETNTVFKQSDGILSFDSEADFMKAVEALRNNEPGAATSTRSASSEEFISIYDEFKRAMAEADDYYQREGGYEEFKIKFPNLYYPEYGEDYAAFLPVSDESVAKLLNQQGKVIIAGNEKDMRDVSSYEKIQELGLDMPEKDAVNEDPTTRAFTDMKYLGTEEKDKMNDKRKAWITLRGIKDDKGGKIGRVDLCFRKKGVIGWYNGQMTSISYVMEGNKRVNYNGGMKDLEYSPHKYSVAYRAKNNNGERFGYKTFYFECGHDYPKYSFTGIFGTDVDALVNKDNGTGTGEDIAAFFKDHPFLIPVVGIIFYF